MNRSLNEHEISYVLYHLNLAADLGDLEDRIQYVESVTGENRVIFIAHSGSLTVQSLADLPILFPSNHKSFYSIDARGNLIFHHDLLKSAFYLLSGYDEQFVNKKRDHWGRVTYEGSIQQRLNIIDRPLVNEYFDIIIEGINEYLLHHDKDPIAKRTLFSTFGFLLSHDIDVIDKFGWPHLGFKLKELAGLAKTEHTKKQIFKATFQSAVQFINPWRSNPYWNFEYLLEVEKKHEIKAAYYFLDKDRDGGSKYDFTDSRLLHLFNQLSEAGHEIGIHGTSKTIDNEQVLKDQKVLLEKNANITVYGGRQHRLLLDIPKTFRNHAAAGLRYDSTIGFAEREGFRNSFCLPFKPYDFENQKAIEIWQFPLVAMDVTLFSHRKLSNAQILETIDTLMNQVEKHHGIFTLLWHNSFFDETLYPGVTKTYERILDLISTRHAKGITGKELVKKLEGMKQ